MSKAETSSRLTEARIENFTAPASGQKFLWDSEVKGFGIRATRNSKTFILDRKVQGRTVRLKIGRVGDWSEDKARKEAKRLIVEFFDKGKDPRPAKKKQISDGTTLSKAFERFMQERALKPRTAYDYERYIKGESKPGKPEFFRQWLDTPISDITEDMIAAKYTKLKSSNRGAAQASSAMRVLRSVINFAIAAYDLKISNPVTTLSKRRAWVKANKRRTHLHIEEIRPFVTALRKVPNPVLAAYLEFILFTGARRNEAAKLTWEDVNMDAGVLTFAKTKNGDARTIPMTSRVREILEDMRAIKNGAYVFSSEDKQGKPSHVTEPRKALAHANSAARTKVTVHDLRRTFSTAMESLDCPMTPLKALLGHSLNQDVTTGHYVVLSIERLRQWSDRYDDYLRGLIDTDPQTKVTELKTRAGE